MSTNYMYGYWYQSELKKHTVSVCLQGYWYIVGLFEDEAPALRFVHVLRTRHYNDYVIKDFIKHPIDDNSVYCKIG